MHKWYPRVGSIDGTVTSPWAPRPDVPEGSVGQAGWPGSSEPVCSLCQEPQPVVLPSLASPSSPGSPLGLPGLPRSRCPLNVSDTVAWIFAS